MSEVAKKLRLSLLILAGLYVVGTGGFVLLSGRSAFESLYVTVVILTTVGMKETGLPLSTTEQAWAMVLMLAGVGTVIYAMGIVVACLVDGQLREMLGRRHLMHKIKDLQNHFIVVGFGRMGQALCLTLEYKGVPFVLIENNEERIRNADALGYLYIRGDAMQEETLLSTGIERARGLAACLPSDADNVFVTLTARSLKDDLHIIARAEQIRSEPKLARAGATRVICPHLISAVRVSDLLLNPLVDEMMELDGQWPDLELSKISVRRVPDAVGKTLDDLSLSGERGVIVVAVVTADGQRHFNPEPDMQLNRGDEVVIVGPTGCLQRTFPTLGRGEAA